MPRELFGEVVQATTTIGSRKWRILPLSIATHSLIIGTVVIVSMFGVDALPTVPRFIPSYRAAVLKGPDVPVAPVAPRPRPADADPDFSGPELAPVVSSDGIKPDTGIVREPEVSASGGVPGGVTNGIPGSGANLLPEAPPPSPVAPTTPIRLSTGVTAPFKIKDARPVYPDLAVRAHVEGTVVIEAIISTEGRVVNARVLRSIPLLDQVALDAVRQWAYTPGRLNGSAVAIIMTVTVTFSLQR